MNYYHAGVRTHDGERWVWSNHTRRSRAAAEREARRMARSCPGAVPVIEWWDRSLGLQPGFAEAATGFAKVAKGGGR